MFTSLDWKRGLAELAIIVVGILIALYVDDWYAGVQQRAQEIAWVTGIRDDLLDDQERLKSEFEFVSSNAEAIRELIANIDDPSTVGPDAVSYLRLVRRAGLARFFRPTATTYTELTGGGNLSAITNRELTRAVIEYHQAALLSGDLNEYLRQIRWFDYSAVVMENLDPVVFAAVTEDWHRQEGSWPPDDEARDLRMVMESADLTALRSSGAFRAALGVSLDATVVQRGDLYRMLQDCERVLALAESELRRLTI